MGLSLGQRRIILDFPIGKPGLHIMNEEGCPGGDSKLGDCRKLIFKIHALEAYKIYYAEERSCAGAYAGEQRRYLKALYGNTVFIQSHLFGS